MSTLNSEFELDVYERIVPLNLTEETSKKVIDIVFWAMEKVAGIEQTGWPLIELGHGRIEVGEGHHEGCPALIFGKNGTGKIGEPTSSEERHCTHDETLAVVTFANVESLDVVAMKLAQLRVKMVAN